MKMLLAILISMTIITSCNSNGQAPFGNKKSLPLQTAQTFTDVSYGEDSLQTLDVYLPAGRSVDSTKSIILIHGGGWNGGSKSEFTGYIDTFRKRMPDYAIFNLNYRLVNGGNRFPTQEIDVKAAVDHILEHAVEYGINKDKMALLGISAGGHLALLQAYKYRQPQIQAVIDFFGPTDLVTMYQKPWHPFVTYALQMVVGATPASNGDLYRQSSPVYYIDRNSPPTLIFHGANDNIVDVSQSKLLKQKLQQAGVKHDLIVYPGERHGWAGSRMSHSFDRIEEFLKENVH
jgi:acetyl esterase/lipase